MAGGQVKDAAPLRGDHHRDGGDGGDQGARENQNTHHDHHDVCLLPYHIVRHINRAVTIGIFDQFRRYHRNNRMSRANAATLRWRFTAIKSCSLLRSSYVPPLFLSQWGLEQK
ncbi:hypothetical protein ACH37Y_05980 [Sphingomonas paucimobilis]|jgi:hypothetical protein|uniref:Uncharacterized protein n=1 Tax=Sphingomonas paucimobilis TaxID=13689 RepID=A0A7Y2PBW4_SPHPI|nr:MULTISPECIES: hypothetical protein [Sphingomonas]MCM3679424.1 hypothetical protein [Sphingomonas paucimobilis]NNG57819.1 hypothetical protein [Sphingomonas paucimobilis]